MLRDNFASRVRIANFNDVRVNMDLQPFTISHTSQKEVLGYLDN